MVRTKRRLSLRLLEFRISNRTRSEPTIMLGESKKRLSLAFPESGSKSPLYLVDAESLYHVADFHVVIAGNLQPAFKSFANIAHVFFESTEGIQNSGPLGRRINHHAVSDQANFGGTFDHALSHLATCHGSRPADFESLANN